MSAWHLLPARFYLSCTEFVLCCVQGHKMTSAHKARLQLVTRSRKRGSMYPLPHTPSWRSAQLLKPKDKSFMFAFEVNLYNTVLKTDFPLYRKHFCHAFI
jgi:hypothetical protein